jgi:hypothetical protein
MNFFCSYSCYRCQVCKSTCKWTTEMRKLIYSKQTWTDYRHTLYIIRHVSKSLLWYDGALLFKCNSSPQQMAWRHEYFIRTHCNKQSFLTIREFIAERDALQLRDKAWLFCITVRNLSLESYLLINSAKMNAFEVEFRLGRRRDDNTLNKNLTESWNEIVLLHGISLRTEYRKHFGTGVLISP